MNDEAANKSNKRTYVQVEASRRDAFVQFLIDNPAEEIKEAARVMQIKYPRATAIWREHRVYVES